MSQRVSYELISVDADDLLRVFGYEINDLKVKLLFVLLSLTVVAVVLQNLYEYLGCFVKQVLLQ